MSIHDDQLEILKESWRLIEMNDGPFNQGEPIPFSNRKKKTEGFFGKSDGEIYDYVKDAVKSGDVADTEQLKSEMKSKGFGTGDIRVALKILPDILSDYGVVEEGSVKGGLEDMLYDIQDLVDSGLDAKTASYKIADQNGQDGETLLMYYNEYFEIGLE